MTKIRCLGGFREVGRSAVLLEGKKNILLEFGLKVDTSDIPVLPKKVDDLIIGHTHLDHIGASPVLFKNFYPNVYGTAATFEQGHLLLRDCMKVMKLKGRPAIFGKNEVSKFIKNENRVTYGQVFEIGEAEVEVHDAGHVPGSAMVILETEGKRILYTSDFNTTDTKLLNGARVNDLKNIDVLITESTYSGREHSPRKEMEKKLFELVSETINNGGIAVIPAFAVGRTSEILAVLHSFKPDFPIFLDGMGRDATNIVLEFPELLRDADALRKAVEYSGALHTTKERDGILKKPCAIVTTGGCIDGGPAVHFIKKLFGKPECSLILTGFQIPGTAGRHLVETGRFVNEGFDLKLRMGIHKLDFSAHSGGKELMDFVKNIKPGKVVCMHGDSCPEFASEIKAKLGIEALAPKTGDVLEV